MFYVPGTYLAAFLPFEEVGLTAAERKALMARVSSFVRAEVALAPAHIRLPVCILSWVFAGWLGLLAFRAPAWQAANWWEKLGGMPARALTRLIRSLALLAFAEDRLVAMRTGTLTVSARQARFRELYARPPVAPTEAA